MLFFVPILLSISTIDVLIVLYVKQLSTLAIRNVIKNKRFSIAKVLSQRECAVRRSGGENS